MSSGPQDAGATSITEIDTELDKDAQAIFERKLATNKDVKEKGVMMINSIKGLIIIKVSMKRGIRPKAMLHLGM